MDIHGCGKVIMKNIKMNTKIDFRVIRGENEWILALYAEGEKEPYHYSRYNHKKVLLSDLKRVLEELEAVEQQVFPMDILDLISYKKEEE